LVKNFSPVKLISARRNWASYDSDGQVNFSAAKLCDLWFEWPGQFQRAEIQNFTTPKLVISTRRNSEFLNWNSQLVFWLGPGDEELFWLVKNFRAVKLILARWN